MIIVISGFCRSAIALRPKSGWRNGGTLTGCLRIADLSVVSELTFNIFAVISRLSYLSPQAWMIAIKQIQVVDQEDSIGKIGRKLAKLRREATERKEYVPGLFSLGGFGYLLTEK